MTLLTERHRDSRRRPDGASPTGTAHTDHQAATVREMPRRHPEHDGAEIERWVRAEVRLRDGDRVRAFVPVLVARAVENRLRRTSPAVVVARREDEP